MKKLFFSLLTLFAATVSWADSALFVHQKSGGVVEYAFSEKPVVTYSEGYLVISVPEASVSYPLSNLQKFTFGDVDDQVTRIVAPVNTAPQPTYIYSLDGKLMRTLQPSEDGTTSASLEGLPSGTYVVKNGKTSYKVLKR
jgi:hypothetical protein